jgi:UDP-glucose 4-epimerase
MDQSRREPQDGALHTALVTGGAGFLGSHLVQHLLGRGRAVVVLDDLSSGSLQNLDHLAGHPDLRVAIGDAGDASCVERELHTCDHVFHLAGAVGVQRLHTEPVAMLERNLRPTEVVLSLAAAQQKPVLITSSSEVYGSGPVPFRESDPVRPGATDSLRGGYACAKAMGEWLALAHARAARLPVVVARIFNTVGPRQSERHGMVLPRFLGQALRSEPITVYGDGTQTRCFAAAGEVVRALVELLDAGKARGSVFNVGSDREVAIAELARLVREVTGSRSPIVHLPVAEVFPRGFPDPPRRVPCLERLRAVLGWAPDAPVERVIERMLLSTAGSLPR